MATHRLGVRVPSLVRRTSVDQALRAVPGGTVVSASPYCATPTTLLTGLGRRAEAVPDLILSAGLLLGEAAYLDQVRTGRLQFRTWHVSAEARDLAGEYVEYVPLRARDVPAYVSRNVSVALVRVTPPDRYGNCSLGPSASYTKDLLDSAVLRIAEIDESLPRTLGSDVTYRYADFDHIVDAQTPIGTYPSGRRSGSAAAIAAHLMSLIRDGSALQLGIGAVPEAIAAALATSQLAGLRLIGLVSDAMVDLAESGRLADSPAAVQAVELLGTRRVLDYADGNSGVLMRSSRTIHDPRWLADQSELVSICTALEVDLTGQVASEQVSGRVIGGVGGSADFFEGANLSHDGIRIIALPSVTAQGLSRLKVELGPDTPVTLPRHSVDYVVTEHGIAHLTGRSLRERAEALVSVAAPSVRGELLEEWSRSHARRHAR